MSIQAGNTSFNLAEAGSAPELENRVMDCENGIAALQAGASAQAADMDALYGLTAENAQSVARLDKRVDGLTVDTAELQNRVNCHERHIAVNKAGIAALREQHAAHEQDLRTVLDQAVAAGQAAASAQQSAHAHHERHAAGGADALSPAAIGALSQPTWAQYKFRRPQQCEVAVLTTLTALEAQRGSAVNSLYQLENGVFSFLEDCVVACSLTARVCPEEANGGGFQVYFLKNNDTTIMEQWYFSLGIQQIALSGIFHMDKGDTMSVVVFPHPGSTRLTWAGQPYGATQEDDWSFLHMQCSPQPAGI